MRARDGAGVAERALARRDSRELPLGDEAIDLDHPSVSYRPTMCAGFMMTASRPRSIALLDLELAAVLRALVIDVRVAAALRGGLVVRELVLRAPDGDGGGVDEALRLSRECGAATLWVPSTLSLVCCASFFDQRLMFPATWKTASPRSGNCALEGGAIVEAPLGEVDAARPEARDVRRLAVEGDDVPARRRGAHRRCSGRGNRWRR